MDWCGEVLGDAARHDSAKDVADDYPPDPTVWFLQCHDASQPDGSCCGWWDVGCCELLCDLDKFVCAIFVIRSHLFKHREVPSLLARALRLVERSGRHPTSFDFTQGYETN